MSLKAEKFVQLGIQKAQKNDLHGASTDLFKAVDIFQQQGRLQEAQQVLEIIKQLHLKTAKVQEHPIKTAKVQEHPTFANRLLQMGSFLLKLAHTDNPPIQNPK